MQQTILTDVAIKRIAMSLDADIRGGSGGIIIVDIRGGSKIAEYEMPSKQWLTMQANESLVTMQYMHHCDNVHIPYSSYSHIVNTVRCIRETSYSHIPLSPSLFHLPYTHISICPSLISKTYDRCSIYKEYTTEVRI